MLKGKGPYWNDYHLSVPWQSIKENFKCGYLGFLNKVCSVSTSFERRFYRRKRNCPLRNKLFVKLSLYLSFIGENRKGFDSLTHFLRKLILFRQVSDRSTGWNQRSFVSHFRDSRPYLYEKRCLWTIRRLQTPFYWKTKEFLCRWSCFVLFFLFGQLKSCVWLHYVL